MHFKNSLIIYEDKTKETMLNARCSNKNTYQTSLIIKIALN